MTTNDRNKLIRLKSKPSLTKDELRDVSVLEIRERLSMLGLTDERIANYFSIKNVLSYKNSTARIRYEEGVWQVVRHVLYEEIRDNIENWNDK